MSDTSYCVCVCVRVENCVNRFVFEFCYCFAGLLTIIGACLTRHRQSSGSSMTCADDDGRQCEGVVQAPVRCMEHGVFQRANWPLLFDSYCIDCLYKSLSFVIDIFNWDVPLSFIQSSVFVFPVKQPCLAVPTV